MEDLLKLVLTNIVAHPDDVNVQTTVTDDTIKFLVVANKDDLGKIIGKSGKTIQAIRSLLKTMAGQKHQWVTIDVSEA